MADQQSQNENDPTDHTKRAQVPIVPADFIAPFELVTANTMLRPLGPEHNQSDLLAWSSSVDHIGSTPGFDADNSWPPADGLTLDQNREDLVRHRQDFEQGFGFTYTVLDRHQAETATGPSQQESVLGCVYIYADQDGEHDADVRSWVVAHRPELDREVWLAVSRWLEEAWPFKSVRYAARRT